METRPFVCSGSWWQYGITLPYIIQLQLQSSSLFSKLTTPPSVPPLVPSLISFMPLRLAWVTRELVELSSKTEAFGVDDMLVEC